MASTIPGSNQSKVSASKSKLIHKLCQHVSGLSGDQLPPLCDLVTSTLASNFDSQYDTDEFQVCEKIKRRLRKGDGEEKALKFAELHRQLQTSGSPRDRKAVLSFLLHLYKAKDESGRDEASASVLSDVGVLGQGLPAAFTSHTSSDVEALRGFTMSSLHMDISRAVPSIPHVSASKISAQEDRSRSERCEHQPDREHVSTTGKTVDVRSVSDRSVSDRSLCKELLFSLQGIEGDMIKYSAARDEFSLSPAVVVASPVRQYVHRLCECGWLYRQVKEYCDRNSQAHKPHLGMIGYSFVAAVRDELNEYYRLISVLEAQLEQEQDHDLPSHGPSLTLRRMLVWLMEPMNRLITLAWILHHCKGKRDAELLNTVYIFTKHGDEVVSKLAAHKLAQATYPLYRTILHWLHSGTILDPYDEFFIVSDMSMPGGQQQFHLRAVKLPVFISPHLASQILSAGKQLHYLRHVLQDETSLASREKVKDRLASCQVSSLVSASMDKSVEGVVKCLYEECSERVLTVIVNTYHLLHHLRALRRYLLLGQGDFIRHLMDLLEVDLSKPASKLYLHNLTSSLEAAVRDTIAQHDDVDVLKRLGVELMEAAAGDVGWDVFKLDYKVEGPLSTVLTRSSLTSYYRLFTFLWRVKRVEYILTSMWKAHTTYQKQFNKFLPETSHLLHLSHLLQSSMMHFIQELQHYIAFEVVECAWARLMTSVEKATHLDQIKSAHQIFLDLLLKGCFLNKPNKHILTQLRAVMDVIVQLQKTLDKMYDKADKEVVRRKGYGRSQEISAAKGTWGLTDEKVSEEKVHREKFCHQFIPSYKSNIRVLSKTYHDMVEKFLLLVHDAKDENLKFLAFRLNFNNYYEVKVSSAFASTVRVSRTS